jgi:nicotinate-nucleotide pyrophosphorylase
MLSFSPSQITGTLESEVKSQLRDQLDDIEVERINEVITKYDLKIDHIQIDNMLSNLMPVLFCPVKEL